MKRNMLIVMVLTFFLTAVQSSAEVRITPDGIPSSADTASIHLNGSFYSVFGPEGAVVSALNTYTDEQYSCGGYFSAAGFFGTGVSGVADGTSGTGVYGVATNTGSVTNYGGYFEAYGSSGRGVYGRASGSSGRGVYGYATGSSGRGVYGEASSNIGAGVYGYASNAGNVGNYGGYFRARGGRGKGVCGYGDNTGSVTNYGGYFEAYGSSGRGVYGRASGSSGRGVYGYASYTGNATNYGGYFRAGGSSGRGVYGYATGSSGIGVYGEGQQYDFYAAGKQTNFGPFTGAHEVKFGADMPGEVVPGLIVSTTGRAEVRKDEEGKISISSTLPTVTLSDRERDKMVFGVIVSQDPLHEDHWYESQAGERFGVVNALGEGRVWVTNHKGAIEAGDYITTSAIPGYGQRQADDLLHSYTLGKAIETVDWERVSETIDYEGKTYKAYLIAVVYTSG